MIRYCCTLDLKADDRLILEYEEWHRNVWPEISRSILESGIESMEIYRYATRLFMIMEVNESFDPEIKAAADLASPKVQEWEELMWKFQQPVPGARPGQKWVLMNRIFKLDT